MEYKEGDLVICTVDQVDNTVTSVHLPNKTKGTIISSEIAPGRIKHMRAYVVPNKKIVCKVLRVTGDHVDLSLRRVNAKEKKEILEEYKQKITIKFSLKKILCDNYTTVKEKILKDYPSFIDFIDATRENENIIQEYIPKECQENFKRLTEKKKKEKELTYKMNISCLEEDGVKRIKEVFKTNNERIKISYISAGNFILKYKTEDFKQAKHELIPILEKIEKKAKHNKCEFEYKEEKH